MKIADPIPIANSLLASLPRADYRRLQTSLETVTLSFGEILYEPGDHIAHVYFPEDALVSLLTLVDHHLALEVGMVGWEGMLGISVSLGRDVTPFRAMVQGAGSALRMEAEPFREEFRLGQALQQGVHRYTHMLMAQLAQTAACNRFHFIEARLARWLLMTRDRVHSDHFRLTHEFLGHMLGVRRVGVTKAALALKQRELIDYTRGSIAVVDGPGLEAAACSCYALDRNRYEKP